MLEYAKDEGNELKALASESGISLKVLIQPFICLLHELSGPLTGKEKHSSTLKTIAELIEIVMQKVGHLISHSTTINHDLLTGITISPTIQRWEIYENITCFA